MRHYSQPATPVELKWVPTWFALHCTVGWIVARRDKKGSQIGQSSQSKVVEVYVCVVEARANTVQGLFSYLRYLYSVGFLVSGREMATWLFWDGRLSLFLSLVWKRNWDGTREGPAKTWAKHRRRVPRPGRPRLKSGATWLRSWWYQCMECRWVYVRVDAIEDVK